MHHSTRTTVVSLLLCLILCKPCLAQDEETKKPQFFKIIASGASSWILLDNELRHFKLDPGGYIRKGDSKKIFDIEDLQHDRVDIAGTSGNVWIVKGKKLYHYRLQGQYIEKIADYDILDWEDDPNLPIQMLSSGGGLWILRRNDLYYFKLENQFIKRPEIETLFDWVEDDPEPAQMEGIGSGIWIVKGRDLYYAKPDQDWGLKVEPLIKALDK